jgi:hypothetical protein
MHTRTRTHTHRTAPSEVDRMLDDAIAELKTGTDNTIKVK